MEVNRRTQSTTMRSSDKICLSTMIQKMITNNLTNSMSTMGVNQVLIPKETDNIPTHTSPD